MNIQLEQIEKYEAGSKIMRQKAEKIIAAGGVGLISETRANNFKTLVVENDKDFLIEMDIEDVEKTRCICQTNVNYGRCAHVLAFLIDLEKYLKSAKRSKVSPSELAASNFTNHFNFEERTVKYVNIRPKFLVSEQSGVSNMKIVIKFEGEREYKVTNIASVIEALVHNRSLEIVKKMQLISGEYRINSQTKKIIDIIRLNSEYQKAVKNSQLLETLELSALEIITILEGLEGQLVDINFTEGELTRPPINQVLSLEQKGKMIQISSQVNHKMQVIISNRLIKSYDKYYLLYKHQAELLEVLKPLASKDVKSIDIPLKYFEKFMLKSKIQLADLFELKSAPEFDAEMLERELTTNIYISNVSKSKVAIKVEFDYQDIAFGYDGFTTNENLTLVSRDLEQEAKILSLLEFSQYEMVATGEQLGYLITRNHKQTYQLLKTGIEQLRAHANVYVDEQVEAKLYNLDASAFTININHTSDLDFFEFDYELNDFSLEQVSELVNSYRKGEQFYILNDEAYIPLTDQNVLSQLTFISQMETEFTELDNKIPFYRYITLKKMSLDLFDDVNIDDLLEQKLAEIEQINVDTTTLHEVSVRDYQRTGMDWLKQLASFSLGGILADEMGLGKTLQVIGFLTDSKPEKTLIVVPKALMYNWAQELTKFAPNLKYTVINGTKSDRIKAIRENDSDIIITSYNMLRLDIEEYQQYEFDICVIDEAQTIKNPAVQVTKAVKKIKAKIKFALTGTPLENNLLDLWSIVDFINPYYLKTQNDFKKRFMQEESNLELLKFHLSPIILRRQKKDVLKELPDKIEAPVFCELAPKQKLVYASYVNDYHQQLSTIIANDAIANSQIEVLSLLTRLRQIACHPSLFLDEYDGDSGKSELLMELISENIENENKMLVFSQFTSFLKLVEKELQANEIDYYYLDGNTKAEERIKLVEDFNNDQTKVFLISLKAGGVGLNLTSASTVIHLDPWWNPQVESQATDRAHRIGQKKVVQVNKLITKGTIEEKIYLLQKEKKQLTDDILSLDSKMLTSLSTNEIIDLFTIE